MCGGSKKYIQSFGVEITYTKAEQNGLHGYYYGYRLRFCHNNDEAFESIGTC
jgi:hypothetical protein